MLLVATVCVMIEGQEICYSYTNEQTMLTTKKYIKQAVAEISFNALTELYGTCITETSQQLQ